MQRRRRYRAEFGLVVSDLCFNAVLSVLSSLNLQSPRCEESAGCFALLVFLFICLLCDWKCSVSLPWGVIGWSALCDCSMMNHVIWQHTLKIRFSEQI